MNKNEKHVRGFWTALILLVAGTVLYRVNGVLYSYLATDIVYSGGALCSALYYLGLVLSPILFGISVGSVVMCCAAGGISKGVRMLSLASGVYLADGAAKVIIDICTGAVSPDMYFAAVLSSGLEFLFCALMLAAAFFFGRRAVLSRLSPGRACVYASLVYMAGRLLAETVYLIRFLVEVDFLPYASEIVQIIGSYLQIAALHGGVVGLTAWGICRVFAGKNTFSDENLHKI